METWIIIIFFFLQPYWIWKFFWKQLLVNPTHLVAQANIFLGMSIFLATQLITQLPMFKLGNTPMEGKVYTCE